MPGPIMIATEFRCLDASGGSAFVSRGAHGRELAFASVERLEQSDFPNMVWVPGGTFRMGSDKHYPEEAPAHRVSLNGFWIDRTPVTNRQFKEFVRATGHTTFAEIPPDPKNYPGALPHMLYAGSLVFTPPTSGRSEKSWRVVGLHQGCDWRHPYGPKSNINTRDNHPVVHVALAMHSPTQMGWQGVADRSRMGIRRAWRPRRRRVRLGRRIHFRGQHRANTWQGNFPNENRCEDGFDRTSPVTAFPPNGYGVYDMIGNVWEWTTDWWTNKHQADAPKACCVPVNPRGGHEEGSYDPLQPQSKISRKVIKGGSHLCAPNYCRRYRPAARHAEDVDTSTSHLGFRCVVRERV